MRSTLPPRHPIHSRVFMSREKKTLHLSMPVTMSLNVSHKQRANNGPRSTPPFTDDKRVQLLMVLG